jgi:hypothetical protein
MKDGQSWRIGIDADVAWIATGTAPGYTIQSAIPLIFDAYATIVVPPPGTIQAQLDRVVLRLLTDYTIDQPWWLGYLDTGGEDVVFADAPKVTLYAGWRYVLVEAGSRQAASWRNDSISWRGVMPDIVFPADRSWLLCRMWDDDWRCLGGPQSLVRSVVAHPRLEARTVRPGEDATPPGHVSR